MSVTAILRHKPISFWLPMIRELWCGGLEPSAEGGHFSVIPFQLHCTVRFKFGVVCTNEPVE
jgi:hypothetical protein